MSNISKAETRREIFILEYLKDLNATRVAIAAGYSEKGARVQGVRLLTNANVKQRIEEALAKKIEKLDITVERVLCELSKLAFENMADYTKAQADGSAYVDLSNLTREQWAAVQEITSEVFVDHYEGEGEERQPVHVKRTKFKLADKRGSLELLGKYLKLFGGDAGPEHEFPVVFNLGNLVMRGGQDAKG
jgi:phage terminase small subunit